MEFVYQKRKSTAGTPAHTGFRSTKTRSLTPTASGPSRHCATPDRPLPPKELTLRPPRVESGEQPNSRRHPAARNEADRKRRMLLAIEGLLDTEDMSEDIAESFRRVAAAANIPSVARDMQDLLRAEEEANVPDSQNSADDSQPVAPTVAAQASANAGQPDPSRDQSDDGPLLRDDQRQLVTPVGKSSFDPCNCVKRIGPDCIASYFVPGWTTIETIPKDAVERWFAVFKKHFRWLPEHNAHVRENFHRKCQKIISDGWHKMRTGKSKGPKWARPDAISAATDIFANSGKLKEQSERGKTNYKGLTNSRGPSKHRGGPKPMQYHMAVLAKQLKRQPYPAEVYKRMKVGDDGRFLEEGGEQVLVR